MKGGSLLAPLGRACRCSAQVPALTQRRTLKTGQLKIYSRGPYRISKWDWEGSGKNVSVMKKWKKDRALERKAQKHPVRRNNTVVVDTVSAALAKAQVDGVSPFVNPLYKKRPKYNSVMDIQVPLSSTEHSLTGIPEAWVWNRHKEKVGLMRLSADLFCQPLRRDILTRVVNFECAQMRGWTTRQLPSRSEMRGSTKKLRPQKGTGKARMSDSRAAHLHKGAKAHGPRRRNYTQKMPKKMRHLGLKVALSTRYQEGRLFIWNDFAAETRKTKIASEMYEEWGWDHAVLFVYATDQVDRNFYYSVRNFPMIKAMPLDELSVHSILKHRTMVVTKEVAEILCNQWSGEAEVQRWNMAAAANRQLQEDFLDDAFPGEPPTNGNLAYQERFGANGEGLGLRLDGDEVIKRGRSWGKKAPLQAPLDFEELEEVMGSDEELGSEDESESDSDSESEKSSKETRS